MLSIYMKLLIFMKSLYSFHLNCFTGYFCYITTAGFTHAAFTFGYEAGINKCSIDGNLVPSGALVTFVQKGLQYFEMEANLSNVSIFYFLHS